MGAGRSYDTPGSEGEGWFITHIKNSSQSGGIFKPVLPSPKSPGAMERGAAVDSSTGEEPQS